VGGAGGVGWCCCCECRGMRRGVGGMGFVKRWDARCEVLRG